MTSLSDYRKLCDPTGEQAVLIGAGSGIGEACAMTGSVLFVDCGWLAADGRHTLLL